ncbi:MAG: DNA methyltransferase [Treponema sp.]
MKDAVSGTVPRQKEKRTAVFHTIINGNCLEELRKLPETSIDLIFADPPYWMRTGGTLYRTEGEAYQGCSDPWDNQFGSLEDYRRFTQAWLRECYRVLSPHGTIWVIGGMQCIYTIGGLMQECGFWLINDVIWHKKNPTPNFHGTRLTNSHETLIWAAKSAKAKYTFHYKTAKELNTDTVDEADYRNGIRKQLGSVWRFPLCTGKERLKDAEGLKLHSTQKPQSLLYRIIVLCSNPGDTVLDPFGGTMTTGAAAKQCGRSFIGIELSPAYCAAGKARLDAVSEYLGPVETAEYDCKHPRVPLSLLITEQYLYPQERLYLRGKSLSAVLCADGRILLPDGTTADIHAGAAVVSGKPGKRLNGFKLWFVERAGLLVSLDEIRERFIRA